MVVEMKNLLMKPLNSKSLALSMMMMRVYLIMLNSS
ncbi:hypothetical protein QR98_0021100 [Sarcoptes scabiei]|uniref:Uncharacterized protein n=1 Tax=Sarcoptes scabiei TaxID=52283 RepID=A0A131ZXZ0_SARSC|nr:hypothetical protein QR98_0021100 [Sarcoptes scabiei]